MEIISLPFALACIIAILIYYSLDPRYRISFLSLLSFGFVATFGWYLLIYVFIFSLVNYLLGKSIYKSGHKRPLFRLGIIINLAQLVLLKYSSFAIVPFFKLFKIDIQDSGIFNFFLPVGISYFTLQGIGYLVNVYMRWELPERKFLDFALYIMYFPKFISGPIERSNHFLSQLKINHSFNTADVVIGLRIALRGFFKKVIVAAHLSSVVNSTYLNPDSAGGFTVLLVVLIQPLYLYFDFSGYTDIAIGFSRAFGINLIQNFERPFLAENVTTFWRKFHISLSSWFNDYIFKQASFRFRKLRSYATVFAVLVTWLLFGIWHGAGWNFMLLGLLQASAIYIEYITKHHKKVLFSKLPTLVGKWAGRFFTYLFFGFSLTFFFAPDLQTSIKVFSKFLGVGTCSGGNFLIFPLLFGLFFALIFIIGEILQNDYELLYSKIRNLWNCSRVLRITTYFVACILILSQLSGNTSFIYEMF